MTISIVLPMYNAEASIANAIESVQNQTYADWELIIVDDGSKDDSVAIAAGYAQQDSRIRILKQENAGPSAARNKGIAEVKSAYLTFIDADDRLGETCLQHLLSALEANAEHDLVCAGYYEQNARNPVGIPLRDFERFAPQETISAEDLLDNIFNGISGVLWAKLFRTEIIRNHNLSLHPGLRLSEDLLFVFQYVKCCRKVALCYDYVYYYNRIGEEGLSRTFSAAHLENLLLFNKLIEAEFPAQRLTQYRQQLAIRNAKFVSKLFKDQLAAGADMSALLAKIGNEIDLNSVPQYLGRRDQLFIGLIINGRVLPAKILINAENLVRKLKSQLRSMRG